MKFGSITAAVILAVAFFLPAPGAGAAERPEPPAERLSDQVPRVTIAMLPTGTRVAEIADFLPDAGLGLMSAGLGRVPASQTYLDIGQGNRVFSSLYPEPLTPLYVAGNRIPERLWQKVVQRAEGAPAEIVPGLMAETLRQLGIRVAASPLSGLPALIAADERGRISRTSGCERRPCPGLTVVSSGLIDLRALADGLRPGDVLFAIERPPPERKLLSIGIVGAGFSGAGLRSQSTRMDGYVLSTDLFPTIADIYGVEVSSEVSGRRIVPVPGGLDEAGVLKLERRLESVSERRFPVLGLSLIGWIVAAAIAIGLRRSLARQIAVLLAVAVAIAPALLLLTAAIEPSTLAEALLVGLGAPAVALLLSLRAPAFAAFSAAAAITLVAAATDVIAGSRLTALSLLGPNPGLGVRFFGIGNELEAILGSLLILGCGAAVAATRPQAKQRRAVAVVVAIATVLAVAVFAPGRWGADVGAAIMVPAGAAATVVAALGLHRGSRRLLLLVLLAPAAALALLLAAEVVLPGDSHLGQSVLGAGGLDELGDVFDRRVTLAARSFPAYIDSPFFVAALLLIAAGVWQRRRVASWFKGRPAAGAATVGAIAATVVGTLANDSGALLLMVGTGYVAAFCGLAWACRNIDT